MPVARPPTDEEGEMYIAMKKLQETLYSSPYYLTEPKKPGGKRSGASQTVLVSFFRRIERMYSGTSRGTGMRMMTNDRILFYHCSHYKVHGSVPPGPGSKKTQAGHH